jgi:hypothetical protein
MTENLDVRTSLALSKDAVCVADFFALASTQGVPLALDKGNNHVVVLLPARCCDHRATRTVPSENVDDGLEFNTAEHIITIAGCKLTMANGSSVDALNARLQVAPNLSLTYGQVIALGGDFYGDPDHPVCNAGSEAQQIEQFRRNFASLRSSAAEVGQILNIAQRYEFDPIAQRVAKHQPPSGAYAAIPWTKGTVMNDEDQDFDQATGGGGPGSPKFGRYTHLAGSNLDHFGEDAMTCYKAGHTLAQQHAIQANGNQRELEVAYAINAFADHFLTDLFATGHMRTPRRKLYYYGTITSVVAGLCAKGMHDEENKFGLWVENQRGDKWVAYGDARYRDWYNTPNRIVMKKALQQSMNDIWDAFKTRKVSDSSQVFSYLPKLIMEKNSDPRHPQQLDALNWAPLFWWNPADNWIYQRNNVADVSDRTYDWKTAAGLSLTVLRELKGRVPYMPQQEYTKAGIQYPPPNEAGPSGEIGWPKGPTWAIGPQRVHTTGPTGPDLRTLRLEDWRIDGTSGPNR